MSIPQVAGAAVATKANFNDDPWIDQYIELVPTAGGPRQGGSGQAGDSSSGFSDAYLAGLARAGGERYAAAIAAGAPNIKVVKPLAGDYGSMPTTIALANALAGSDEGGLGLILPIVMIGSVFAAIAVAGGRLRERDRHNDTT